MSDMLETEIEHFLSAHHAELIHCNITLHGTGGSMDMPQAYNDP
jgi:hypothetical protein